MVSELLSHAELAAAIKSATDDQEIQMLLNQVSGRRRFLQLHAYGPDPVVMTLRRTAADFHFSGRDVATFVQVAKNAHIPIVPVASGDQKGRNRYWIFAAQHSERAQDAFNQNPSLMPFLKDPLTQPFGPTAERPRTSRIVKKKGFIPLTPLFLELRIGTVRNPRYALDQLFTDECPVPIYEYRDRYSCTSDQADELKVFLQTRKHVLERRELIDSVKKAAYGELDPQSISPIELYQQGMIFRSVLVRQSTPLAHYLRAHSMRVGEHLYPALYTVLSAKIPSMIICLDSFDRGGKYRIYSPIADMQIETIAEVVEELKNGQYPQRTPEERQSYQQRLLKKIDSRGNMVTFSLDEAMEETIRRLLQRVRRINWANHDITEDVVSSTLEALLPQLLGERGDFESYDKFEGYAFTTAKYKLLQQIRKSKLEFSATKRTLLYTDDTNKEHLIFTDELDRILRTLPTEKAAVLRLRVMGINIETIAEMVGKSYSSTKEMIYQSLDEINPTREKRETPFTTTFNFDIALSDYKSLRNYTFQDRYRPPTGYEIKKAYKRGEIQTSLKAYIYNFGYGSWPKAQKELEKLVSLG
ncbi:MAG: hypothetical protein Q8P92_01005 [Candidatus Daviesbacteria bacterium]|nr:hypothetical protein [Candidatus Daviesbacteria bacterium]